MKLNSANFRRGITLIEVLVIIAMLVVIAALLIPKLAAAKRRGHGPWCINNLKQIGLSFKTWAIDNSDKYPMQLSGTNGGTLELINGGKAFIHFQVMSNELTTTKLLVCPEDKARTNALSFAELRDKNISYFVAVDTDNMFPSSILSGDANILTNGVPTHGLLSVRTNTIISWTTDRHGKSHNLLMLDGSVQQTSQTNLALGRLAIP